VFWACSAASHSTAPTPEGNLRPAPRRNPFTFATKTLSSQMLGLIEDIMAGSCGDYLRGTAAAA
jgi:hypothetical protein